MEEGNEDACMFHANYIQEGMGGKKTEDPFLVILDSLVLIGRPSPL